MSSRKQGQTIRSEARNLIRRVVQKCDEESRKGQLFFPLQQANARIAEYTGVSLRTVSRIRKEDSIYGSEPLASPGKKRRKMKGTVQCTEEDKNIIRNIIYRFYVENQLIPTGPKLLDAVRAKINFPWEIHSLRRLLKNMGFEWKKSNQLRKILVERPKIVACRGKYLRTIRRYRTQERNVIYVGETLVESAACSGKLQNEEMVVGTLTNPTTPQRLILVHAGGKTGFVPGAQLMFEAPNIVGNYQMGASIFEKWVMEKLIPNIPSKTVIVMNSTPYDSVQVSKPPTKYGKRQEMVEWLVKNKIPYNDSMLKYELYEIIERNKQPEKLYKIDEIIELHGHTVLRLPPSMRELNPLVLGWAHIKMNVRGKSPWILTYADLENFTMEAVNAVTSSDWETFSTYAEKLEKEYCERDAAIEELLENEKIESNSELEESDSDESSNSASE